MNFTIEPIGIVHSPFKEKFGVPRQPGLVNISSQIEILSPFNQAEAFKGLESFSHIWVTFIFHQAQQEQWRTTVRPPRLGGNKKIGVFASRSPFRPNSLGLSVAALENLDTSGSRIMLNVQGLDLIDQTPVVDIKPYISYVDSVPDASEGFAVGAPEARMQVIFSPQAEKQLQEIVDESLRQMIVEVLSYDVRPAYQEDEAGRVYGMRFSSYDIQWQVNGESVSVVSISSLNQSVS